VKNTDGVRTCLEKQGEAELLAFQIKQRWPQNDTDQSKKAEELYNTATVKAASFLNATVQDAKLNGEVRVSKQRFTTSEASAALDVFIKEANGFLYGASRPVADPATVALIATVTELVIDKIIELDKDARVAAIESLKQVIAESKPRLYDDITAPYIANKYGLSPVAPSSPTPHSP
jgi:hypothetical protein